jgi:hypothetical protein
MVMAATQTTMEAAMMIAVNGSCHCLGQLQRTTFAVAALVGGRLQPVVSG